MTTDIVRKFAAVKSLLIEVLPECFICPACGPFVKADEDGCCAMCGADTRPGSTKSLLPKYLSRR